jgi:hypothetical protein
VRVAGVVQLRHAARVAGRTVSRAGLDAVVLPRRFATQTSPSSAPKTTAAGTSAKTKTNKTKATTTTKARNRDRPSKTKTAKKAVAKKKAAKRPKPLSKAAQRRNLIAELKKQAIFDQEPKKPLFTPWTLYITTRYKLRSPGAAVQKFNHVMRECAESFKELSATELEVSTLSHLFMASVFRRADMFMLFRPLKGKQNTTRPPTEPPTRPGS